MDRELDDRLDLLELELLLVEDTADDGEPW